MFKFLRKYNKLLLAIFGVLLMITFLIPEAIQQFGQSAGGRSAVATVDGRNVSQVTWQQVQGEVQFLQRMGVSLPGAAANQIKPEHWFLLSREADEAGLVPSPDSIDLPQEMLESAAQMTGLRDPHLIRTTMAKLAGVSEMLRLFQNSGALTDRQLKHAAERMLGQVVTQVVVVEAEQDESYQPTEEELQRHFEKYADTVAEQGSFGYRLPNRVKLEWLKINVDEVQEMVRNSEQYSSMNQRLHWKRFESDPARQFPKVEPGPVPDAVKNDLLTQLTREKMDEIARFASDQLRLNRRGVPERDGYVVLPEDWEQKQLKFPQLAQDIQARYNIPLPAYHSTGDEWKTVDDVGQLPGVGNALSDHFGSAMTVRQMVDATKEFENHTQSSAFIQKDIAGPPARGADGSMYVFRIIDVSPAHRPASLDEVREQVVTDLQRMHDFKRLQEALPQIEQQAENEGMLSTALAHNTILQPTATLSLTNRWLLMQLMQQGMRPMIMPSNLPVIGSHRPTVEKVLDYAATLPKTKPVDQLTEQERVLAVPVEDKQAVLVFRIMSFNPVTQEDFADMVQQGMIQQLVALDENPPPQNVKPGLPPSGENELLNKVFGYDAVIQRNNFTFLRTNQTEEGAEPVETAAR